MAWARVLGVVALASVALGAYGTGVRRLRRRGIAWPGGRQACWTLGTGVAAAASVAPVPDRFSGRVVEHAVLGMVAPWLLVAGRPVTLALRSSQGRARRAARALVHGGPLRGLAHPMLAAVAFGIGPWVLWLSPIYQLESRSGLVHGAVHVHLLVTGVLFGVAVLGLEPTPWRSAHGVRMLAAAVLLPVHTLLGMVLLTAREPLLNPDLAPAAGLADQRLGAGLVWVVGDGLATVAMLLVGLQWARAEGRPDGPMRAAGGPISEVPQPS
jgi:putative membrane protein